MGKKFGVWFIVAAIICSAFLVGVPQVQAATPIYVDASRPDDTGNGLTPGTAKKLIQSGINLVEAGGTVNVAAGLYTEDLTIVAAQSGIEIIGADKATTIIKGVANTPSINFPACAPNIHIDLANNVKIHGFTIQAPTYELAHYTSGIVIGGIGVEIYDNAFLIGSSTTGDEQSRAMLTYSNRDLTGLKIYNNTFTDNYAGEWGYEGIYVNVSATTTAITIEHNQFTGDLLRAIAVDGTSGVTIHGNTITTDLFPSDVAHGAYVGISIGSSEDPLRPTNIAITDNLMQSSGSGKGFWRGLNIGNILSGVTVTGNTFRDNLTGVWVASSCLHADSVLANSNNITNNTAWGVNNAGTGTFNATNNWWGSNSGPGTVGPGTGDKVSANVNFTPWATNTTTTATTNTATTLTFSEGTIAIGTPGAGTGAGFPLSGQPSGTANPSSLGFRAAQWWDISFTPSGCTGSVTITVAYNHALGEETFALYYWDGAAWQLAGNQVNGGHNGSGDVLAHHIRGTVPVAMMGGTGFGLFGNPTAMPSMDWWALAILCLSMLGIATLALYRRRYLKD